MRVALFAAALLSTCLVARADTFQFSFTGTEYGSSSADTVSFRLPSSPTPDSTFSQAFIIDAVPVLVNNQSYLINLYFGSVLNGLALASNASLVNVAIGIDHKFQVFEGPTSSPTFLAGTYVDPDAIIEYDSEVNGVLTVTDLGPDTPAAVTPEPSSFALLGTGILGVFGVMKRRFA